MALVGKDELFWPEVSVNVSLVLSTVLLVLLQSGMCDLKNVRFVSIDDEKRLIL